MLNGVRMHWHGGRLLDPISAAFGRVLHFPLHHTGYIKLETAQQSACQCVSYPSQQIQRFKVVQPGAEHHAHSRAV